MRDVPLRRGRRARVALRCSTSDPVPPTGTSVTAWPGMPRHRRFDHLAFYSHCMAPSDVLRFTKLQFNSGLELEISPTGIFVIIGPNNVGKSTLLGELSDWVNRGALTHNNRANIVLAAVEESVGDHASVVQWLEQFQSATIHDVTQPQLRHFRNWGTSQQGNLERMASSVRSPAERAQLGGFLACRGPMATFEGDAPDYFQDTGSIGGQNKQFDDLYKDQSVERRISQISQDVFGTPVTLSRLGRRSILHFGSLPEVGHVPTASEVEQVRAVPKVSEQGMGVTGFLSLAITLALGQEPIVLLDEPDAHLHPPQAYKAGKFVAERGARSQVFVVTHSLDFLHGIIDSGQNVTIVRLDRDETNTGRAAVLPAESLRSTWRDTAVRYSGALAGLMHRGVVLCEGDGDCRYYEVTLDYLTDGEPPHDLRFVHAGGKAGVKKLARALADMSVPVSCCFDFDFLRDWADIEALVTVLGGDPAGMKSDWKLVNEQLAQRQDTRTAQDVANEVSARLSDPTARYNRDLAKAVTPVVKPQDGWSLAKVQGQAALGGEPFRAADRLLASLDAVGIHVLRLGELESLHREVQKHGPAFVGEAIELQLFKQLSAEAKEFVKGLRRTSVADRA